MLEPATFLIRVALGNRRVGLGSGFLINPDHVVTNAHVATANARSILVANTKIGEPIRATLVDRQYDRARRIDFALLKLARPLPNVKPLQLTERIQKAQPVVAAGYPGFSINLQNPGARRVPESVLTRGAVRVIARYGSAAFRAINHDADIDKGNSGGPLVDECGRVVGVNTYVVSNRARGVSLDFAQTTTSLLAFLKRRPSTRYTTSSTGCVR
ncbi:MAG: serine protease [Pseudomonadota bacterium]